MHRTDDSGVGSGCHSPVLQKTETGMEDATLGDDHGSTSKRSALSECDKSCRCRGTGWGSVGSVAPHHRVVAMASEDLRVLSTSGDVP